MPSKATDRPETERPTELRLAVVGPGSLGQSLARLAVRSSWPVLGFVGRDPDRLVDAVRFSGAGRPLRIADLANADLVLLTVPDAAIVEVADALAAVDAVGEGAVWAHCSGARPVSDLDAVYRAGAQVGAIHPVCPVPDRERGVASLPSSPALVQGTPSALDALSKFARALGLRPYPVEDEIRNPALYHAACALAANGTTGLLAAAVDALAQIGLDEADSRTFVGALVLRVVEDLVERGPRAALSGPLVRGDTATVRAHLAALRPEDVPLYRAAMGRALELLPADTPSRDALADLLAFPMPAADDAR